MSEERRFLEVLRRAWKQHEVRTLLLALLCAMKKHLTLVIYVLVFIRNGLLQ
jgi:hypothetical protein